MDLLTEPQYIYMKTTSWSGREGWKCSTSTSAKSLINTEKKVQICICAHLWHGKKQTGNVELATSVKCFLLENINIFQLPLSSHAMLCYVAIPKDIKCCAN
jgi:hypothetical protein